MRKDGSFSEETLQSRQVQSFPSFLGKKEQQRDRRGSKMNRRQGPWVENVEEFCAAFSHRFSRMCQDDVYFCWGLNALSYFFLFRPKGRRLLMPSEAVAECTALPEPL